MENDDQVRKFNELGRLLAGHEEELDELKAQLEKSRDENLKVLAKYVDTKLQTLKDNLALFFTIMLYSQTNPNFSQEFTKELDELSTNARQKGISLKDYVLELKKNGTLPTLLKKIMESIDKVVKSL